MLGAVGRNFAAGMSGGTAYVVDLPPARVNPDMVDLEELDAEDIDLVGLLLRRHAAETGSAVAKTLLADWNVDAGPRQRPVHQGDAARLPQRPRRTDPGDRARTRHRRHDHGGVPWLTREAF